MRTKTYVLSAKGAAFTNSLEQRPGFHVSQEDAALKARFKECELPPKHGSNFDYPRC
jgi:hypothetical protein